MGARRAGRRPLGSGALFLRTDAAGRETWYGKWRIGKRQVKRRLGPRRSDGSGLTLRQAEAALRAAIARTQSQPLTEERLTLGEAAQRYVHDVERVLGRKPSTVQDYRSIARRHLEPFFSDQHLEAIGAEVISDYSIAKRAEGLSLKTVANHLRLLHAIFSYATERGWTDSNPVRGVERPRATADADIRFLSQSEIDALVAAVPDDALGRTDRALYLTAAHTGLRQGELIALRWRDIDWSVSLIRVRRSFTRGQFGTPKSRRSNRAIPMAEGVANELAGHLRASHYTDEDDLVFGHPATGGPYDPSRMRKRFYEALFLAGVRRIRFHDLRHTFGTRMAAAGAPLRAIQEWMGHSNYQTTLVYADYAPDPSQGTAWAQRAFGSTTSSLYSTGK